MMNSTTLCFGRFLIDLPEGVHIRQIGQQSSFMYGDIYSEKLERGVSEFEMRMLEREAEARRGNNKDKFKFVEVKKTPSNNTRIFIFNDDVFGRKLFQVEMYHFDGGILYSLSQGPYNNKTINEVVKGIENDIVAHLRPRKIDEIPSAPGFCFKDGFIENDDYKEHFEEARMQINLKEWPDVWVAVYSQTVPKAGDESLLQRIDKYPESPLEKAYIKTFRRGKRDVNGFKGEELLDLLPTENGVKQHYFHWEALGQIDNVFAPLLDLEFETAVLPLKGPRPRPSLTDEQAIKLYDTIVSSIRLRPTTAPAKTSANEPPKKPLGEQAITGRICPQTGWWQTSDAGVVAEWRRRHFMEGELLPSALRREEPTLWQKIKGERPIRPGAVVWQLVGYGHAPNEDTQVRVRQETGPAKGVEPPTRN